MKVITAMLTCKKLDEPDDSSSHYIYAFEVHPDYAEDDPVTSSKIMQYSEIAQSLKKDKKSFILKDEAGKNLELFEKDGSIILKRDNVEFTNFQGNVRMNERFDPNMNH